jgi:hypothetical protein
MAAMGINILLFLEIFLNPDMSVTSQKIANKRRTQSSENEMAEAKPSKFGNGTVALTLSIFCTWPPALSLLN